LEVPRRGVGRVASASSELATHLPNPNILVVDDEPGVREYICGCLTRTSPYCCTGVGSTREALTLAREWPIDVALVDLSIAGEDGLALARRLRNEVHDLPVVLITGSRNFAAAVEGMRVGILDYLMKPLGVVDLVESVDRAVAWRRAALRARSERSVLQAQLADQATRLSGAFAKCSVASLAALDALLETLNQRNPDALAHARRVATFSVMVAGALEIADPLLSVIECAALLHDLGKIAIPDAVICKPGPLTAEEFAVMRTHAQVGYDIAVTVPFLRPSAEIVLATHERMDGSGYPRGLKGEAIPIGARIIAVTDAFDALTSPRVYRSPFDVARANAELVRTSGTQFDPDVVAAWLRCVDACELSSESEIFQ
jgi:response regulator RpfG family c-di-GMP phosphodiesterase